MSVQTIVPIQEQQEASDGSNDNLISWYPGFEVRFTEDKDELNQVKKLRLQQKNRHTSDSIETDISEKQKNKKNFKKLIDEHKYFIHDGYDSHTKQLIVKDTYNDRIIAYVRIIDSFTAFKIGGFYSETRFNLSQLINNQQYFLEISCLVIDEQYHNKQTIKLLWSGLTQYAQENGADAIIGIISIPLAEHFNKAVRMISALKSTYISDKEQRVRPYQLLPGSLASRFSSKALSIDYLDYLFSKGIKICGDAYWNRDNNSAELFVYYAIDNIPKIPECIQLNEIELGRLCE